MNKKHLAIALGLLLGGSLAFAPTAFGAEAGNGGTDASSECTDGEGDQVPGTLSVEGDPAADGADPDSPADNDNVVGEVAICITQTGGNADGAARIGGDANGGEGYLIADGNGGNREETKGYIGLEADTTPDDGAAPVGIVSDGEDCSYGTHGNDGVAEDPEDDHYNSHGNGTATDPAGVVDFVTGAPGAGTC